MFFFFFNNDNEPIFKTLLQKYLDLCFDRQNYCDVSKLISDDYKKNDIYNYSKKFQVSTRKLYNTKYPKTDNDLNILNELYDDISYVDTYNNKEELFLILYWCFKIFKNNKGRKFSTQDIMLEIKDFISQNLHLDCEIRDTIIYNPKYVKCHIISSLSEYFNVLNSLPKNLTLYFRGHSKTSYCLEPSIFRTKELKQNESNIYRELMINCPDEFNDTTSKFDCLVKMQHYGLPTRLLDISKNPLVAMFFACKNNQNNIGEIVVLKALKENLKWDDSESIKILSELSFLPYDEQINIIDKLFIQRNEEDKELIKSFEDLIKSKIGSLTKHINAYDCIDSYIVLPKKANNRIMKQDGAFIICGTNESLINDLNKQFKLSIDNRRVCIFVKNKSSILKELDAISINEASLFPEIDHVADYIKSKYDNQKGLTK